MITGLAALATATLVLAVPAAQARLLGPGPEMRPSFETLDADGDGQITEAEMKAFGDARFKEADTNGDGLLSAEEMAARAAKAVQTRLTSRFERMVKYRDKDGDGLLSAEEMTSGQLGARFMEHFDSNDDGKISAEEFADAMPGMRRGMGGHGHFPPGMGMGEGMGPEN